MAIGATEIDATGAETQSTESRPTRFAFERQIKFLTPPMRSRSLPNLWREVFSHGGNVVRIYQLKPWTFVEYPSVAEADEAFKLMAKKNVVGSLFRTNELVRALKGLDPVCPKIDAKPTFQFHKQLKFLSADLKDHDEKAVKDLFGGKVVGVMMIKPWTFVQFSTAEKAREILATSKNLKEVLPSLRETVELVRWLGPAKVEPRFKHAFERQLKFDTSASDQMSITEIKDLFEAGGSVTKVFHLGKWTFVEYPSIEETEAAFNILHKKTEHKLLMRTDELVAALRAKKKMRQLRIARNENEDMKKVAEKCNCPNASPLEVTQSLNWTFVEYRSPEAADSAFEYLRQNQLFLDVQKTSELKQWRLRTSSGDSPAPI